MKYYSLFFLTIILVLSSCIKDEPRNTECDILSAWVEGDTYKSCFFQPETDMRKDNILYSSSQITFTVKSLISLPKIPLHFNITPGATIEPANGSEQDFTHGPVIYTVTSEDGAWKRQYKVEFREAELPTLKFSFENCELINVESFLFSYKYYSWFEYDKNGEKKDIWATGNQGFGMGNSTTAPEKYPTAPDENGYCGKCVRMQTLDAGPLAGAVKKYIAAGNLFIGKFDVNKVFSEKGALESTLMGKDNAFPEEPFRVTGYYKYKPGAEYWDEKKQVVKGKVDEADIYAVLYRNIDDAGNPVVLDGGDVLTSKYIVSKARVKSLPPTDEWKPFEMFFEDVAPVDQKKLKEYGYNLALVFSSSKEGASFCGAVGSTLYVDEVVISLEKD